MTSQYATSRKLVLHVNGSPTRMILIKYFFVFDGDVPRRPSYGVYISQVIRFARVSKISNNQELVQSEPKSYSQNQSGN